MEAEEPVAEAVHDEACQVTEMDPPQPVDAEVPAEPAEPEPPSAPLPAPAVAATQEPSPVKDSAAPRMTAREARRMGDELGAEIADNAPRAASVMPSATPVVNGDDVTFQFGDRRWRVRGVPEKPASGCLRVNVLVTREGGAFHVDTLELYSARQRAQYTKLASEELVVEERVVKRDLGEVLLKLKELLEKRQKESRAAEKPRELTEAEQSEALALLRDPKLLERILGDFERCGVVGESTNKLVGYLAATSRKLEQPLAIVIRARARRGSRR